MFSYRVGFLLALAFILLYWRLPALAADARVNRDYQIEMIIFSQANPEALKSEYWPSLAPLEIPAGAVELSREQLLPVGQRYLNPLVQLLEHNQQPVLLHIAWTISAEQARQGQLIHLFGGDTYQDQLRQVNGTLVIRLERYFSMHFNLQFLLPIEQVSDLNLPNVSLNPADRYLRFKINERLRMRSNELNYIDHPLYGILIEIR